MGGAGDRPIDGEVPPLAFSQVHTLGGIYSVLTSERCEPRALYRCKEERKRCRQQNKVLKKELPRCCRDRRKSARRRFCYTRCAQEERQGDKKGRGGHHRSQCGKNRLKRPENESRCNQQLRAERVAVSPRGARIIFYYRVAGRSFPIRCEHRFHSGGAEIGRAHV